MMEILGALRAKPSTQSWAHRFNRTSNFLISSSSYCKYFPSTVAVLSPQNRVWKKLRQGCAWGLRRLGAWTSGLNPSPGVWRELAPGVDLQELCEVPKPLNGQAGSQKPVTKETAGEHEADRTKFTVGPWVRGPQCQDDGEVRLGEALLTLTFARIIEAAFLFSFIFYNHDLVF